ncbi:LYR motif-containing protein 4 [Xylographa trunciseda]|nr:LYR motif-containing protein 4 [Xylographa trunciseda]
MSLTALKGDKAFQVRSLFRSLLRQSSQFAAYNFREYARRRTKDSFREHETEVDERKVQDFIQRGLKELQMMKRQTVVSQFFQLDRLVVEGGRTLRNNRTNNRTARGQIDHDAMEGLPVRQWRKSQAVVNTAPPRDNPSIANTRNPGWQELPMPRGSELYSSMSQALLRAARMGQINRPKPTPPDDEKEPGEDDEVDGDIDTGYVAIKWSQVSKELEEPEMEFLAKRRKGLPSVYGGNIGSQGSASQMRKVKVRRVDAEGNSSVWDVLVPEGTVVEGEIVEGDGVTTEAPAAGTVVEGVGIANAEGVVIAGDQIMPTPPRRRPPPPKRRAKGPGRGRKKRSAGVDGIAGIGVPLQTVGATAEGGNRVSDVTKPAEGTDPDDKTEDVEMADGSVMQDGEEGSDEDDDEGDVGDEGDEVEDGDREDGELSPSPTPDVDAPGSIAGFPLKRAPPGLVEPHINSPVLDLPSQASREQSSSPDLPLASEQANNAPGLTVHPAPETPVLPQSTFLLEIVGAGEPITTDTSATLSSTKSELPVAHNPSDGQAAPRIRADHQKLHLAAGESDLFGSLERHLNEKS